MPGPGRPSRQGGITVGIRKSEMPIVVMIGVRT